MAEIQESGGKKSSPKVDMTPMVDLGFLLITFFMLTTTFSKPQSMQLNMPDKNKDQKEETTPTKESETITLLLGKDNKLFWYQGLPSDPALVLNDINYSSESLRKLILEKTAAIGRNEKGENKIVIIIKPLDDSKYKNVVDILDEMNITLSQRYAIVDVLPVEKELVAKHVGI